MEKKLSASPWIAARRGGSRRKFVELHLQPASRSARLRPFSKRKTTSSSAIERSLTLQEVLPHTAERPASHNPSHHNSISSSTSTSNHSSLQSPLSSLQVPISKTLL